MGKGKKKDSGNNQDSTNKSIEDFLEESKKQMNKSSKDNDKSSANKGGPVGHGLLTVYQIIMIYIVLSPFVVIWMMVHFNNYSTTA